MTLLSEYKKKRKFERTPEPSGKIKRSASERPLMFVVQKHRASRLHYDFRLELDGVLKSWAIPKGPSLDPSVKRLAMMTEDHPLEYRMFEGTIPKGNYGAGEVIVWDDGVYHSAETADPKENRKKLKSGLMRGHLDILLLGKKLKGRFLLHKIKGDESERGNPWLLIKQEDEYASGAEVVDDITSVRSRRTLP